MSERRAFVMFTLVWLAIAGMAVFAPLTLWLYLGTSLLAALFWSSCCLIGAIRDRQMREQARIARRERRVMLETEDAQVIYGRRSRERPMFRKIVKL